MTVEQLKTAVANLPPQERTVFADWIAGDEDVRRLRHERLKREIQIGLDQLARGEGIECRDSSELRAFFDHVKSRSQGRLAARQSAA